MPEDADAAITAICDGIESGRIARERLNASLQRRQQALARVEHQTESELSLDVEQTEDRALAQTLVELTCESQGPSIAHRPPHTALNLIRIDGVLSCPQLPASAPALLLPEQAGFRPLIHHPMAVSIWKEDVWSKGDRSAPLALDRLGEGPVLLQLFLRGNPFRAGRDQQEPWAEAIDQLQACQRLAGLVVYGSPYAWESLRSLLEPTIPAAYSPGQMPEAQHTVMHRLFLADSAHPSTQGPGEGFTD